MVVIKFYGELYEITKVKEYIMKLPPGSTSLLDLIKTLSKMFGTDISKMILDERGRLRGRYIVLINGAAPRATDPVSVEVKDEDVVAFIPSAVGGCYATMCYDEE